MVLVEVLPLQGHVSKVYLHLVSEIQTMGKSFHTCNFLFPSCHCFCKYFSNLNIRRTMGIDLESSPCTGRCQVIIFLFLQISTKRVVISILVIKHVLVQEALDTTI